MFFLGHLGSMGAALNKSLDFYNKTVGSLESNVLPSLRQMREKGIAANDTLPELKPIEDRSRVLTAPEAMIDHAVAE